MEVLAYKQPNRSERWQKTQICSESRGAVVVGGVFFCPPARLAFDFICVPCEEGPPFESALIGFECVYTIDGHVSKRTRVPDVFSFVASTGVFNQKRPAVRIITRLGSMSSRFFFFCCRRCRFFKIITLFFFSFSKQESGCLSRVGMPSKQTSRSEPERERTCPPFSFFFFVCFVLASWTERVNTCRTYLSSEKASGFVLIHMRSIPGGRNYRAVYASRQTLRYHKVGRVYKNAK